MHAKNVSCNEEARNTRHRIYGSCWSEVTGVNPNKPTSWRNPMIFAVFFSIVRWTLKVSIILACCIRVVFMTWSILSFPTEEWHFDLDSSCLFPEFPRPWKTYSVVSCLLLINLTYTMAAKLSLQTCSTSIASRTLNYFVFYTVSNVFTNAILSEAPCIYMQGMYSFYKPTVLFITIPCTTSVLLKIYISKNE